MKKSVFALGIDGGGSKTEVVLAELNARDIGTYPPRIIASALSGSSNLRSTGKIRGLANLDEAVDAVFSIAGLTYADMNSVVLALAGSSYTDVQEHIAHWCQNNAMESVYQLIPDVEPVLHTGSPHGYGIALIAGTGSVCIGRNARDDEANSGGWGHWFGDKGSGFDIGRRGMEAVVNAEDKTGPDTQLTKLIQRAMQADSLRELLDKLSAGDSEGSADEKYRIAQLAPVVIAAAESGDRVARLILGRAAAELAKLVVSVASSLYPGEQYPLALAGGTLCGNDYYRTLVLECLSNQQSLCGELEIVTNPVLGCLSIAHERLFGCREK